MSDRRFLYLTGDAYEGLYDFMRNRMDPAHRALTIIFDPRDRLRRPALYSTAAATDLIPILEEVLLSLKAGTRRMPVSAQAIRWTDEDAAR